MRLTPKLTLLFLLVSLVPTTAVTAVSYAKARTTLTAQVLRQMDSIASLQKSRVQDLIAHDTDEVVLESNRLQLRRELQDYEQSGSPAALQLLDASMQETKTALPSFRDLWIVNPSGKVTVSTRGDLLNTDQSSAPYLAEPRSAPHVDTFFSDSATALGQYLTAPLDLGGQFLGTMVIQSSSEQLTVWARNYTGLGETGESGLAAKDKAGNILSLNTRRFHPVPVLSKVATVKDTSRPVVKAVLGQENTFTDTVDYRGQHVLSATRYIPETGWGLTAKIDQSEAYAPITELGETLAGLIGICLLLTLLLALLFADSITQPILALVHSSRQLQKGDLSQRVAVVNDRSEIGELGSAFNAMAAGLQEDYLDMERITERKTAQLNKKVEELERANQQMVGRELRILELKRTLSDRQRSDRHGKA